MRSRRTELARVEVPNLAPMVDVVMVILIFFMLGTSFAMSEGVIPMQLPSDIGPGGAANVTVVPVVRIAPMEDAEGRHRELPLGGRDGAERSQPTAVAIRGRG